MDKKIDLIDKALNDLEENLFSCNLCPRKCHVNRGKGEIGACGVGALPIVSSYNLHFGEEPCLSGYYDYSENKKTQSSLCGSGTVFFSGCNLRCVYCQNYQISWHINGSIFSVDDLASAFLSLQKRKSLNINLVTPTHVIIPILKALKRSFEHGLSIPLVYNTSAYDSYETISKLNGIVDIYLPDFKYFNNNTSLRLSNAPDYPEKAADAIKEMYRQVGNLEIDDEGNAKKGLLIRHLVLPNHVDESCRILEWIAKNLLNDVSLSIMSQYYPCYKAPEDINRRIFAEEYATVLKKAEKLGFENVYTQPAPFQSKDHFIPDFESDDVFPWNHG
ncbi:MAG: radical SAM protein [Deltaproteobacteria bacterium]|nr:radical SAM protein [Deltaproteobacteria bacterium]